ncbi:hypothetical protein D3C77_458090 [compost metagenome]
MTKYKLRLAIGAAALFGFPIFCWVDTQDYRATLSSMPTIMPARAIEQSQKDIKSDTALFLACTKPTGLQFTPGGRACVLDAISKSKTVVGAAMVSTMASAWLEKNPTDVEVRNTALSAIARARAEMIASKSWNYDSREKLAKAHDRSLLLRLRDGLYYKSSPFVNDSERLDQAEYKVLLPEVVRRQQQWLTDAFSVEPIKLQ